MWDTILDDIKTDFSLSTDYELAFHLRVSPSTIGHIRSGARQPSIPVVIKLLDKRGYAFTRDRFLSLLPDTAKNAFLKSEKKRMASAFERDKSEKHLKLISNERGEIEWTKAFDLLKQIRSFSTDREVAETLKITTSAVGNVKGGARPLASGAKLLLLYELGIILDKKTLAKVVPPDLEKAIAQEKLSLDFVLSSQ